MFWITPSPKNIEIGEQLMFLLNCLLSSCIAVDARNPSKMVPASKPPNIQASKPSKHPSGDGAMRGAFDYLCRFILVYPEMKW